MNSPRFSHYEIDLNSGIVKATDEADHRRALEMVLAMKSAPQVPTHQPAQKVAEMGVFEASSGIKIAELIEQYFKLKKQLKQATVLAYTNTANELQEFTKKKHIAQITESDVIRYQNYLAERGNSPRTIDNKLMNLSSLFNFAIQQNHYREENPAKNKALMTKKQKLKSGWGIFDKEEIEAIFNCDFLRTSETRDKDYFYCLMLALFTGARVGEVTSLTKSQFKKSVKGTNYIVIRDAKTFAGVREIPLYKPFYFFIKPFLDSKEDSLFKYEDKDGKGSGNAVGKKFSRHLTAVGVTREKLVFHSLRKFVNNTMMFHKVAIEARCQMIGHELDNVNVATYTQKVNIDELADLTETSFASISKLLRNQITITDKATGIELQKHF